MADFCKPVQSYMHAPVHTIHASESLVTALERLHDLVISSLAVVDDDSRLCGVISRSDLIRAGRDTAAHESPALQGGRHSAGALHVDDAPVSEVMTREVITVPPSTSVQRACRAMVERGVHRVFIVSGSDLVGVFSTRDVMRVVSDARLATPIEAFMSRPVFTVSVTENLARATELLQRARISGVVVTENDWPVGLFSQSEALESHAQDPETSIEEVMNPSVVCMPTSTRMFRAARQALTMNVRRIIAAHDRDMVGILSGLDFARAVAADPQ